MSHANVPLVVGVVLVWSLMMTVSFLISCMASFLIAHARFLFACTIVAPCMEGGLVARFHVILDILSSFKKKNEDWSIINHSYIVLSLVKLLRTQDMWNSACYHYVGKRWLTGYTYQHHKTKAMCDS